MIPHHTIQRDASPTLLCLLCAGLLSFGCGGSDEVDGAIEDAGAPEVDAGFVPDMDQDEWLDEEDNCPTVSNPEQRDRDQDGFGDACDSCPATPNNGQNGQVGQDGCDVLEEVEPNDSTGTGTPLALVSMDRLVEARGAIEAPGPQGQAWDRYSVMVPARTMLRVRVARTRPESLLEPVIRVTGGSFESPRYADDLFVAERDIYVSAAGTYEIAVADRRGVFGEEAYGEPAYGYALSVRTVPYTPETVTAPLMNELFRLLPRGSVKVLEAELGASERTRIATQTGFGQGAGEGFDPILVLEKDDGATVIENDDLSPGFADARIITAIETAQRIRVVIDFSRLYGRSENQVLLSLDQPQNGVELEPNDTPALATPLIFPGETTGQLDRARAMTPDVDVYSIQGTAGQIAAIHALLENDSQLNPYLVFGRANDEGELVPLFVNADSSGLGARVDVIIPETGTYYVLLGDERNTMPPYVGGNGLFPYRLFAEITGLQPASVLTSTGTLSGAINPGGKVIRHVITTPAPMLLALETESVDSAELEPFYRVFGPGAITELGAGEDLAYAYLPAAASYIVGVQNANAGAGGPAFRYTANATLFPMTAVSEIEPNDIEDNAQLIVPATTVLEAELSDANDKDRSRVVVPDEAIIDAVIMSGGAGRQVAIYQIGATNPLITGQGRVTNFTVPGAGHYFIEVSSMRAGPYVLLVRVR